MDAQIIETRPLREEAEARFKIRNLEAELEPTRPSKEILTRLATSIGPGNSVILHDRTGAPFALASVRNPRILLDAQSLVQSYAVLSRETVEAVRARHSSPGNPFFEFKEATL